MAQVNDLCEDAAYLAILVAKALQEVVEDSDYHAVRELRHCANRRVFNIAKNLTQSETALERELGVHILAQFGYSVQEEPFLFKFVQPYKDECADILLAMIETETDLAVIESIAIGFGNLKDERAIPTLIKLKNHPDEDIRFGVVLGLIGHEDERAIQALIELSQDKDADVRDWATFGIGSILDEVDTPAIRTALYRNLDDSDEDTRYEALMGLIIRRDHRIWNRLIDLLATGKIDYDTDIGKQSCEMLTELQDNIQDPRLVAILTKYNSIKRQD